MKFINFLLFIALSLQIFTVTGFAQNDNPDILLNQLKTEFEKINDYQADVLIKVDIDFLQVPDSKAEIYFKQPDKIKLVSEGFAMLPKQGLDFSPSKLLAGNYSALFIKNELLGDIETAVIKVIPTSDSAKYILSTLWIDTNNLVVRKIETTAKNSGTFEINLVYEDAEKLKLPSEVKFIFNLSGLQLPGKFTGELFDDQVSEQTDDGSVVGTVTVFYSHYKVNQGLSDSFFEE